jgi:hypothetical protein
MDKIQGNKIIADYMELEGQHEEWCGNNVLMPDKFLGTDVMTPYCPDENWADLMPAVTKICNHQYPDYFKFADTRDRTPFEDYAYLRTFGMRDENGLYMVRFNATALFKAETLIEATWLAVVDFIEWINTNKK